MTAYYNEIDPYAAQWLRNLIDAGHIASGDVDERSIIEVKPGDLRGYTQAHFFAGIGGWSIALRLAGWPDERPVWTGSCPCQPFSAAGKGAAADDERHLWPAWFSLIAECAPPIIFGEQVEAAIGWGWIDAVFVDLEAEGYACGTAVLPACGVGAPHIRNRLWFVANASSAGTWRDARNAQRETPEGNRKGCEDRQEFAGRDVSRSTIGALDKSASSGRPRFGPKSTHGEHGQASEGFLVNAESEQVGLPGRARITGSATAGFWSDAEWIACTDGKSRPVEPGTFPLGHGIPKRASKLRAFGNAIVPQVAAEFIRAAT
jgi:DNA (cytosine-5)-methyltransferase 1